MKELFQKKLFETVLPETNIKHLKWSKSSEATHKHGESLRTAARPAMGTRRLQTGILALLTAREDLYQLK